MIEKTQTTRKVPKPEDFSKDIPEADFNAQSKLVDPVTQMAQDTPPGSARPHVQEPNPDQWKDPATPLGNPQAIPSKAAREELTRSAEAHEARSGRST